MNEFEILNKRGKDMKKTKLKIMGVLTAVCLLTPVTSLAMIKNVEINADLDSVNEVDAGICFFPDYEVEDDDIDVQIAADTTSIKNNNPTIPATVNVTITSDAGALDDDLKISGTGIRSTYVDMVSVDNTEATGRLLVYPLYELVAPQNLAIDAANKQVSWSAVPYAGKYEVVITYVDKNGNEKTSHATTEKTYHSISTALANAYQGSFGVAVRAIPTDEQGYQDAAINEKGMASWTGFDTAFADEYEVRVSYTGTNGKKVTTKFRTKDTYHDVSGYMNSAQMGTFKVTVRAIPKKNDAKYYNIAFSDWSYAGSYTADTSDYDIDDKWEFLSDYKATVEGDFATNIRSRGTYNSADPKTIGSGSANASWKRTGYKWQYIADGVAYNQGWKQINGQWYYFDPDSFMHTGWLELNGARYYLESKVGSSTGAMVTGTRDINGKTYIFGDDGICLNY